MTKMRPAPSLQEVAERFARGEPVLVTGISGGPVLLATGISVGASDLLAIRRLGGDTVVLGLSSALADRLAIPDIPRASRAIGGLHMLSPIDAADTARAAWSLSAQVHTIEVATCRHSTSADLMSPGHVHVGRIDEAGYQAPRLALELAKAACGEEAVIISRVLNADGHHVDLEETQRLPEVCDILAAPSAQLVMLAAQSGAQTDVVVCQLPSVLGNFRLLASESNDSREVVVTLVYGRNRLDSNAPIHTHVRCLFGDAFHGQLCDCQSELDAAVADIITYGSGALIYVYGADSDPFYCPSADRRLIVEA